ncbi:hypothetical protein TNCV_579591 [Trichonephila clavipes]|nr:hypothetical protein TNCV_579591 [Trichonephila clavipes]
MDSLKPRLRESLVYADKPQTLDHLEDNIRRVIADIRPQMLEKVIENWTSRMDYIRASRGSYARNHILNTNTNRRTLSLDKFNVFLLSARWVFRDTMDRTRATPATSSAVSRSVQLSMGGISSEISDLQTVFPGTLGAPQGIPWG